jgi:cytoskeletal protein CcmA (bactofilin family)
MVTMRLLLGRKRRAEERFLEALPVRAAVERPDRRVAMLREGVIENLTQYGASFRSAKPVDKHWLVDMRLALREGEVRVTGRIVRRKQRKTEYGPVYEHGVEFLDLDAETSEAIALHCASPETSEQDDVAAGSASASTATTSGRTVGLPVLLSTDAEGGWVDAGMGTLASVQATGVQVVLDRPLTVGTSLRAKLAESLATIDGRVGDVHSVDTRLGARFVTTIINSSFPLQGSQTMNPRSTLLQDTRTAPLAALLTVNGARARIEGTFDIEDSIEVQCEIAGNLRVGATLVIGERGVVSADVSTVNAVIRGTYTGNLKASGSVEIASTGRVTGTLESSELIIAKGAVFTGNITHVEQQVVDQIATALTSQVIQQASVDVERQIPVARLAELPAPNIGPAAH